MGDRRVLLSAHLVHYLVEMAWECSQNKYFYGDGDWYDAEKYNNSNVSFTYGKGSNTREPQAWP